MGEEVGSCAGFSRRESQSGPIASASIVATYRVPPVSLLSPNCHCLTGKESGLKVDSAVSEGLGNFPSSLSLEIVGVWCSNSGGKCGKVLYLAYQRLQSSCW